MSSPRRNSKAKLIKPEDNCAIKPTAKIRMSGTTLQNDEAQGNSGKPIKHSKQKNRDISLSPKSSKPIKPQDNKANMPNANKGTAGTNRQHDQVHGNRGKQINPNQHQQK